jgi:hypothetical protein
VIRLRDGTTSVNVALTAKPNTTYDSSLKCVRLLGNITTDDEGAANGSFDYPTNSVGNSYSFEAHPEGAVPAGRVLARPLVARKNGRLAATLPIKTSGVALYAFIDRTGLSASSRLSPRRRSRHRTWASATISASGGTDDNIRVFVAFFTGICRQASYSRMGEIKRYEFRAISNCQEATQSSARTDNGLSLRVRAASSESRRASVGSPRALSTSQALRRGGRQIAIGPRKRLQCC